MQYLRSILAWILPLAALVGGGGAPEMQTLVVGGGPDKPHNQVAIEANVRYFAKILPPGTPMRVIFADGNPESVNVQILKDRRISYRKPDLPRLDGPATLEQVRNEFNLLGKSIADKPTTPTLIYFTGHGSGDERSNYANNRYDLWDDQELTVRGLASCLNSLPVQSPTTIVMVQCFSGAFGNLLFEHGDPAQPLTDRDLCGFFAATDQRMAAGCTPEINEADYQDFSGYFFAALTGTDRVGRKAGNADYNRDGRVGMNEAFAYCLMYDESIDVPVCTSDVFLRKFVTTADDDIMKTPYPQVRKWADAAQGAALDGLTRKLSLTGSDLLQRAYATMKKVDVDTEDSKEVKTIRLVRLCKSIVLGHTLRESGAPDIQKRFARLLKLESGNPFRG